MYQPHERTIIKPRRRNTSMYTQDINSLLSSYLLDEECAKDVILDVTSPSHPYVETREYAKERATDKHLTRRSSERRSADVTGNSSEDSFVTCASQEPESNSHVGGDGQSQSKQNHSPKESYQVSSLKFSPLATSSPPVSLIAEESLDYWERAEKACSNVCHDDSGFGAPQLSEDCVTCSYNQDLNMNNSCELALPHQQCASSKSHTRKETDELCLEKRFTGISLQDEATSPKECSELEQNTEHCTPVNRHNAIHRDSRTHDRLSDLDDSSSLFSHISIGPATHQKNTSTSCPRHYACLPSGEDSLDEFIPDEFNLSDLNINTNKSHKTESGRPPELSVHHMVTRDGCSPESAISSASTIDYLYSDPEEGITLIERHCPPSIHSGRTSLESVLSSHTQDLQDSDNDTVLYSWEDYGQTTPLCRRHSPGRPGQTNTSSSGHSEDSEATLVKTPSTVRSEGKVGGAVTPDIPAVLKRLSNVELRRQLVSLRDDPGPVTPSTRQTYLIRLVDLQNNPDLSRLALSTDKPGKTGLTNMAFILLLSCLAITIDKPGKGPFTCKAS